jgi:hypothetical protein
MSFQFSAPAALGNKEAIEVNQAWAGSPGSLVKSLPPTPIPPSPAPVLPTLAPFEGGPLPAPNNQQLWTKPLPAGEVAVLLINASPKTIPAGDWKVEFGSGEWVNMSSTGKYWVRDIWERRDTGVVTKQFVFPEVAAFDSAFLKFSPSPRASHSSGRTDTGDEYSNQPPK